MDVDPWSETPIATHASACGQVEFGGNRELTVAVDIAGRRIAIGLAAATAIAGTAVTASGAHPATRATAVFGSAAAVLTGGLLIDVLRRR